LDCAGLTPGFDRGLRGDHFRLVKLNDHMGTVLVDPQDHEQTGDFDA
jgi:hypothetical protein